MEGRGRCGERPRYGAMPLSRLRHRQAHPGRYAGLHPTKLELAFTNVSGDGTMPNPVVHIAAGDVDAVLDQVFRDSAFANDLTYYPNSNIFVSAKAA